MEAEKKYFAGWWLFVLGLVLITGIVFSGVKIYNVVIERQVFKRSHQYREARETETATFRAQLSSIERKLVTETDENVVANLEAQAESIRIHLDSIRNK